MSKLLSSTIQDGAVNLTSLNKFRAMQNSAGPNCFADITLKVSKCVFLCTYNSIVYSEDLIVWKGVNFKAAKEKLNFCIILNITFPSTNPLSQLWK